MWTMTASTSPPAEAGCPQTQTAGPAGVALFAASLKRRSSISKVNIILYNGLTLAFLISLRNLQERILRLELLSGTEWQGDLL